jgi:hypothetical protein
MANIKAVVEKLDGKINIKVIKLVTKVLLETHKTIGSLVLINTLLQNNIPVAKSRRLKRNSTNGI